VVLAAVAAAPINAGIVSQQTVAFTLFRGRMDDVGGYVVGSVVFWNLLLASFNLLPIAPLDGFKAALGILPGKAAALLARLERLGPGILLLLVASALIIPGTPILVLVIRPILNVLSRLVLGGHLW
jgi:Zn-dependent protease